MICVCDSCVKIFDMAETNGVCPVCGGPVRTAEENERHAWRQEQKNMLIGMGELRLMRQGRKYPMLRDQDSQDTDTDQF